MSSIDLVCAHYDAVQNRVQVAIGVDGKREVVNAEIKRKALLRSLVLRAVFESQESLQKKTTIKRAIELVIGFLKKKPDKDRKWGRGGSFQWRTKGKQKDAVRQAWNVARWSQGSRDGLTFSCKDSGKLCGEDTDRIICQALFQMDGDEMWLGQKENFPVYLRENSFKEHANRPSCEKQLMASARIGFPSISRFVSAATSEKLANPDFSIDHVTYPLNVMESSGHERTSDTEQRGQLRGQATHIGGIPFDHALSSWFAGNSRVLILSGGPGTGKTWSLAVIACRILELYKRNTDKQVAPFPFCARVADIAPRFGSNETPNLKDAILEVLGAHISVECNHELARGTTDLAREFIGSRSIILLDAWDESSALLEPMVLRALKGFLSESQQQESRIILTTRNADTLRHDFPLATTLELLPADCSTDTQITQFVELWFGGDAIKSRKVLPSILANPTTRELFKVPLLAAIILRLYEDGEMALMIRNRSDLLHQGILAILKRAARDACNHPSRILSANAADLAHDILTVLAKLAYETFDGQAWSIDSAQFTNALKSEPTMNVLGDLSAVLEALTGRFGIFSRSPADGRLFVIHQAFAEYLAAQHVHTVFGTKPSTFRKWIAQHAGIRLLDPRWKETWCYLASQTDFPEVLLEEVDRLYLNASTAHEWPRDDILDSALCLAGNIRSIVGIPSTTDKNRDKMISWLIERVHYIRRTGHNSKGYIDTLSSLIRSGEFSIIRRLFSNRDLFADTLSTRIMGQLGKAEHKVLLDLLQSKQVRGAMLVEAVTLLDRFPDFRQGTLEALEGLLCCTENKDERISLMSAIGCVRAPDHDCNELLLALESHKDEDIRNAASNIIGFITESRRLHEAFGSRDISWMDEQRLDSLLLDRKSIPSFANYEEFTSVKPSARQQVNERLSALLNHSDTQLQAFAAFALQYMGEADSITTAILDKIIESGSFRERVEATRIMLINGVSQADGERLLAKLLNSVQNHAQGESFFSIVSESTHAEFLLQALSKISQPDIAILDCAVKYLSGKVSIDALAKFEDIHFRVLLESPDPITQQTAARVLAQCASQSNEILERYLERLEVMWENEGAIRFLSEWAEWEWANPQGRGQKLAGILLRLCREIPSKSSQFSSLFEYCDGLELNYLETLIITLVSHWPANPAMYATAATLALKYRVAVFLLPDPRRGNHSMRKRDLEELPRDRLNTFFPRRVHCGIIALKSNPLAEANSFPVLDGAVRCFQEF